MSKKKPPVGRYEGDYYAVLTYDACSTTPYRVEVAVWDRNRDGDEGWYQLNRVLHKYGDARYFKRADRAVKYLHKVKAEADLGYLYGEVDARSEKRRNSERIL